jgi:hypothetical protein
MLGDHEDEAPDLMPTNAQLVYSGWQMGWLPNDAFSAWGEEVSAAAIESIPMARGRYYPVHPDEIDIGATVNYRDNSDYEEDEAPDDEIWHDVEARLAARGLHLRDTGSHYVVARRAEEG